MPRHLLAALLLTGCATETLLVVDVRTDFVPGVEFTLVQTEVAGGPTVRTPADANADYVASQRAAEVTGLAEGMQRVTVSLFDDGRLVTTRDVLVEVRGSVAVTVLLSRDCGGVVCSEPDSTCVGGVCADPRCSEEASEFCPDAECAVDGDCTSGDACFAPACYGGFCVFGQGNRCGPEEYCYPGMGCISLGPVACDDTTPCVCDPAVSCDFECPGGGCTFDCRSSSACFVDCAGGDCAVTCAPSAFCDVGCSGDGCTVDCQLGSSCGLECASGACDPSTCSLGCNLACVGDMCSP
ncbi:MAG: hypothetical protein R3B82_13030 [Sandaracinaceae bacterium]